MEAHGLRGSDGDAAFFGGEFNADTFAAFVEVAAKIVVERLALHAGDDARADDESANIRAGGFFNIFLEEDVRTVFVIEVEGLEGGFSGLFCVGEDDTVAMRAGSEFNNNREANLFQEVVDVGGIAANEGFRGVDAGFG